MRVRLTWRGSPGPSFAKATEAKRFAPPAPQMVKASPKRLQVMLTQAATVLVKRSALRQLLGS